MFVRSAANSGESGCKRRGAKDARAAHRGWRVELKPMSALSVCSVSVCKANQGLEGTLLPAHTRSEIKSRDGYALDEDQRKQEHLQEMADEMDHTTPYAAAWKRARCQVDQLEYEQSPSRCIEQCLSFDQ